MKKEVFYTKTDKGSLESARKKMGLSEEEYFVLVNLNGTMSRSQIDAKCARIGPSRVLNALNNLITLGLVAEKDTAKTSKPAEVETEGQTTLNFLKQGSIPRSANASSPKGKTAPVPEEEVDSFAYRSTTEPDLDLFAEDTPPIGSSAPNEEVVFATDRLAQANFEEDFSKSSALDEEIDDKTTNLAFAARKQLEQEAIAHARLVEEAKKEAAAKEKREEQKRMLKQKLQFKINWTWVSIAAFFGIIIWGLWYLFVDPIDKTAVEKDLSTRFGQPVKIAQIQLNPWPLGIEMSNVQLGSIIFSRASAVPDVLSLFSGRRAWRKVQIDQATLQIPQLIELLTVGQYNPPAEALHYISIKEAKIRGVSIQGTPIPVPAFDATITFIPTGGIKYVEMVSSDDRARLTLSKESGKSWEFDFRSTGVAWFKTPGINWDRTQATGTIDQKGLSFTTLAILHFGGTISTTAASLTWEDGWQFNAPFDVNDVNIESIGNAFYQASAFSGLLRGKVTIEARSDQIVDLWKNPLIVGDVTSPKATLKGIDLARLLTGFNPTGHTDLRELTTHVTYTNKVLRIEDAKSTSGLLSLLGRVDVESDGSIQGRMDMSLGKRANGVFNIGGTVQAPTFKR